MLLNNMVRGFSGGSKIWSDATVVSDIIEEIKLMSKVKKNQLS